MGIAPRLAQFPPISFHPASVRLVRRVQGSAISVVGSAPLGSRSTANRRSVQKSIEAPTLRSASTSPIMPAAVHRT